MMGVEIGILDGLHEVGHVLDVFNHYNVTPSFSRSAAGCCG